MDERREASSAASHNVASETPASAPSVAPKRSRIAQIKIEDKSLDLFGYPLLHPAASVNSALDEFEPKSIVMLKSESQFSGTKRHVEDLLSQNKVQAVEMQNGDIGYIISPQWLDRLINKSSEDMGGESGPEPSKGVSQNAPAFKEVSTTTVSAAHDAPVVPIAPTNSGADIFGCRLGYGAARMNTFLSETIPRTVQMLTELSGYENTPSHILQLRKEKKIEAVFLPDGKVGWIINPDWIKAIRQNESRSGSERNAVRSASPTQLGVKSSTQPMTDDVQVQKEATIPSTAEKKLIGSTPAVRLRRPVHRSGVIVNETEGREVSTPGVDQRQTDRIGKSKPESKWAGGELTPRETTSSENSAGQSNQRSQTFIPIPKAGEGTSQQNTFDRANTASGTPVRPELPPVSGNNAGRSSRHSIEGLSKSQELVFDFIESRLAQFGESPTVREVQAAAGLNHFETINEIDALVRKGVIEFDRGKPRGLTVIPESERVKLQQVGQSGDTQASQTPMGTEMLGVDQNHATSINADNNVGGTELSPQSPNRERSSVQAFPWIDALLESETLSRQYAMAGRRAPSREQLQGLLQLLASHGFVVHRETVCQNLGLPTIRYPGFLSMMMRLVNVDNVPILTRDESGDMSRIHVDLLCRQFGLTR